MAMSPSVRGLSTRWVRGEESQVIGIARSTLSVLMSG
jgi:hypothetical protein